MGDPIVTLRGIRVSRGAQDLLVVDDLAANEGEVLAVVGPNGAGKSTLLRVIGLLERPAAGEVRFRGRKVDPRHALAERRRMATVFQQPLLADMTVFDNVALGLRFRGFAGGPVERRVDQWLDRLAIRHLRERAARTLSGGEAQRVALARALVLGPELLLLDEPFAALDQPSRGELIPHLAAILEAERVTAVLVTHDRAEAQALGDRVAVMLGGRIHQIDEVSRVFRAPVSEEVARFVGVETLVDGRVLESEAGLVVVDVAGHRLQVAASAEPGERVRIGIRPEDVTLMPPAERTASSARNHLPGVVVAVMPSSPHVRVVVDCGFPLVAALTARSVEELGLRSGAAVAAVFKASAAHLIRHSSP